MGARRASRCVLGRGSALRCRARVPFQWPGRASARAHLEHFGKPSFVTQPPLNRRPEKYGFRSVIRRTRARDGRAQLAPPAEAGRRHSCHHLRAKVVAGRLEHLCKEAEDSGDVKNLYTSMPRRFKEVIDADGGPTSY